MRDIVRKRSATIQKSPPPSESAVISIATQSSLSLFVERSLEVLSKTGGWLAALITPQQTWSIIQPAQNHSLGPAPKLAAKKKGHFHKSAQKVQQTLQSSAKHAKGHLKTPVGKLALSQAATILAVLMLVSRSHSSSPTPQHPDTAQAALQPSQYRLLPVVGEATTPQPFEEKQTIIHGSTIPFNTWVTPWNSETLKENSSLYSSISAFWLSLQADGFSVTPKADWKNWQAFRSNKKDGQQYFATISADPNYSFITLTDLDAQKKHIAQLLQIVEQNEFDGIDIDYEGLGKENRNIFSEFIRNLTIAFHDHHKLVSVTVEARISNQVPMDWHNLSTIADEVRIMVYDYHSKLTDFPGPIAPLGWLKEVLDYADKTIDPKKLIVGLGNYGYDWVKSDTDPNNWQGTGIGFDQAIALAKTKNTPIVRVTGIDDRGYDIGSIPSFTYKDEQDHQHAVWFEDNASLQTKLSLVAQYKVKGVIFWSIGLGDKAFWQTTH